MTTKKIIFIILGILLIALLYWVVFTKHKQDTINELNKTGVYEAINDSLHAYTAALSYKFDSVLNANKDLLTEIRRNKETPGIITVWRTNTVFKTIEVPTAPDTAVGFRVANYNSQWLVFNAKYQIIPPYTFEIANIVVPNRMVLTQVTTTNGRKKIYLKSENPYVQIENLETYVDPVIFKNTIVSYTPWSIIGGVSYAPKTKNVNTQVSLYTPLGIGVSLGVENAFTSYNFGLGFKKDF